MNKKEIVLKPMSDERLIKAARLLAKDLETSYEDREDLEDDELAFWFRKLAERLEYLTKKE